MRKCNICGRRFRLLAKNRYEVKVIPTSFSSLTEKTTYHNAFDCPYCGCQNLIGTFEKHDKEDEQ